MHKLIKIINKKPRKHLGEVSKATKKRQRELKNFIKTIIKPADHHSRGLGKLGDPISFSHVIYLGYIFGVFSLKLK